MGSSPSQNGISRASFVHMCWSRWSCRYIPKWDEIGQSMAYRGISLVHGKWMGWVRISGYNQGCYASACKNGGWWECLLAYWTSCRTAGWKFMDFFFSTKVRTELTLHLIRMPIHSHHCLCHFQVNSMVVPSPSLVDQKFQSVGLETLQVFQAPLCATQFLLPSKWLSAQWSLSYWALQTWTLFILDPLCPTNSWIFQLLLAGKEVCS